MELSAVIISGAALLVSIIGVLWVNDRAREANRKADNSNKIAQEANELAQSANVYASEANVLSKQGVEVSQKTYENQYVPKITVLPGFHRVDDRLTNLFVRAGNEGHAPVLIAWIGISIVGSEGMVSVLICQPRLLPTELLPGHILDIPIDIDHLGKNLALYAKSLEDEFTIRLVQHNLQYFETAKPLKVKDHLDDELLIGGNFQEAPPQAGNDTDAHEKDVSS